MAEEAVREGQKTALVSEVSPGCNSAVHGMPRHSLRPDPPGGCVARRVVPYTRLGVSPVVRRGTHCRRTVAWCRNTASCISAACCSRHHLIGVRPDLLVCPPSLHIARPRCFSRGRRCSAGPESQEPPFRRATRSSGMLRSRDGGHGLGSMPHTMWVRGSESERSSSGLRS